MDRLKSFAKTIVEHCCAVQPGERVLVEVTGCEDALAAEVIRAVYDAGGVPFYSQIWASLQAAWLERAGDEAVKKTRRVGRGTYARDGRVHRTALKREQLRPLSRPPRTKPASTAGSTRLRCTSARAYPKPAGWSRESRTHRWLRMPVCRHASSRNFTTAAAA